MSVRSLVRPSVCPSVHTFVKDVSASTGRNDFIFDVWLWHGDLYRVSAFQVYRTSTSCLQCDLEFFMFAVIKPFVTDISASTGRNDFIFDIWLLHGELYRVSPFQVYRTSTSYLPRALELFMFAVMIYKFDTNERVGVILARRSVQHLVFSCLVLFCFLLCFVFVAIIYYVYRQYREYIIFTLNYFEGRVIRNESASHHGSQNKNICRSRLTRHILCLSHFTKIRDPPLVRSLVFTKGRVLGVLETNVWSQELANIESSRKLNFCRKY